MIVNQQVSHMKDLIFRDVVIEDRFFESESDAEEIEDYKEGGYHPVYIGEYFKNSQYLVIQKLGWGMYSTVWLVQDTVSKLYLAMKIIKSDQDFTDSAFDELRILKDLYNKRGDESWVRFCKSESPFQIEPEETFNIKCTDAFEHQGIYGQHCCIIFELMPCSLIDIINYQVSTQKLLSPWFTKLLIRQILAGLVYIHDICHVVHTDIKPENVLIKSTNAQTHKLITELVKSGKVPQSMRFIIQNKQIKRKIKEHCQFQECKAMQDNSERAKSCSADNLSQSTQLQQENFNDEDIEELIRDEEKIRIDAYNQQVKAPQFIASKDMIIQKTVGFSHKLMSEPIFKYQFNDSETSEEFIVEQVQTKPENYFVARKKFSENICDQLNFQDKYEVFKNRKNMEFELDDRIKIQIIDFSNSCYENQHIQDLIQTREYRSVESILGAPYTYNTDMWSLACLIFQLLTNTLLFNPNDSYIEDETTVDLIHLKQIVETLGDIPASLLKASKNYKQHFQANGQYIFNGQVVSKKAPLGIAARLRTQYHYSEDQACKIEEFLLPMLSYDVTKRTSASKSLLNPWLCTL